MATAKDGPTALIKFQELAKALQNKKLTPEDMVSACSSLRELANQSNIFRSYAILLPLFLSLKGRPYSIYNQEPGTGFFPMEPMYKADMPFKVVWKCGRQVSKSTSLSAQGVLQSITMPYFSTLFVTPLFEMTRRLSSNYVRLFIDESPIKSLLIDSSCNNSVLQRTFINKAVMYFTFAFLDCERARGISCDKLVIDEIQNLDWDFLGVLRECMSASRWGVSQYSGTPKTFDNTIELLWQDSSMAEFCTKCPACNHWNIPNLQHDILKMIGKTGLKCAKCDGPIVPKETGMWIHQQEERKYSSAGYHVPQIIMPMHYELPNKWAIIWDKYNSSRLSQTVFYNECLGESCDVGTKLLTISDIKAVSVESISNDPKALIDRDFLARYSRISMGVDWGGQTAPVGRGRMAHLSEDMTEAISFTTVGITGQRADGKQQCIFAYRFPIAVNHMEEVSYILQLYRMFRCSILAHDFGGSGAVRETLLVQAGISPEEIMPLLYTGNNTKNYIVFNPADETRPRNYWSVDKSRSLMTLCMAIKSQQVLLPNYGASHDVTHDLLALMEDKVERPGTYDILRVVRQPKQRDDFAHSLNYSCIANWHSMGSWPHFGAVASYGAQDPADNPTNGVF